MQQEQTRHPQPLTIKLNVSKLFETFESEARNDAINQKLTYSPEKAEASYDQERERLADRISVLIQRYRYHKKQQFLAGEAVKRKEAGQCKRLQSEAITLMIRAGFYRQSQIRSLEIPPERILTEISYREKLTKWIINELRDDSPVWLHLLYLAGWGESIDYSHLRDLDKVLTGLRNETELISERINIIRRKLPEREKYDQFGQEIEYEPLPEWMPPTREQYDEGIEELCKVYDRIKEAQKEYDKELHRTSNLKKIPENFCYQLFESINYPTSPEALTVEWVPDEITGGSVPIYDWEQITNLEATPAQVNERIRKMSGYYLEKLVTLICGFYNDFYTMEIEETRREQDTKRKADMYIQRKKYTTDETKELIQIGKADGMKQREVAEQLSCGIATVKRYWNE